MASEIKEIDGKTYLQCKECNEFKELNSNNWYKHNEGFMGFLGRCKECIKKGRKTDGELKMARVRDRDRYYNNVKRRDYIFTSSSERRKRKGYANVHNKADRLITKQGRPTMCSMCNAYIDGKNIRRLVFHHPDYTKPFEGVFCCDVCHSKIHSGKIDCTDKIIDLQNIN